MTPLVIALAFALCLSSGLAIYWARIVAPLRARLAKRDKEATFLLRRIEKLAAHHPALAEDYLGEARALIQGRTHQRSLSENA